MGPFDELTGELDHLIQTLISQTIVGNDVIGLTQFHLYFFLAIIILCIVAFTAAKKTSLVPKGRFVNMVESVFEYLRANVVDSVLGPEGRKHAPFLITLFFFILINNYLGNIPGSKPGTGGIGFNFALATISFIYFVVAGVKAHGALGYVVSLAPSGLALPIRILVWAIEVFSTLLRIFTLAFRLFANLFAGHIVLGAFSILASLFFIPLIQSFTINNLVGALPSLGWMLILIFIWTLEIVVSTVQALVFTLLSAVYIKLAEQAH
ncbi:MAG: F0F1 ATP synthase subunit A [Coriobacteriia bacterium]|nr:F0F1 ATP synthase subunit A [Coriobacteriia bacterium]